MPLCKEYLILLTLLNNQQLVDLRFQLNRKNIQRRSFLAPLVYRPHCRTEGGG